MIPTVRRALVAVAALAVAVSGVVATAPEAQAACYVKVSHPSKVSITGAYKEVVAKLYDPCGISDTVWYSVVGPEGSFDSLDFGPNTQDYIEFYDWYAPPGTYKVRNDVAWDEDYNDIPASNSSFTVKLGTGARLSSFRNGSWVGFDVLTRYYSPKYESYRGWKVGQAKLQKQYRGEWVTVKTFSTNSSGVARVSIKRSDKASYRVVVPETGNQWSATSVTTNR